MVSGIGQGKMFILRCLHKTLETSFHVSIPFPFVQLCAHLYLHQIALGSLIALSIDVSIRLPIRSPVRLLLYPFLHFAVRSFLSSFSAVAAPCSFTSMSIPASLQLPVQFWLLVYLPSRLSSHSPIYPIG